MHEGSHLKILHVIESTATGVLSMASALASEQAERHEVEVAYSRRAETPVSVRDSFSSGVRLVQLQMSAPKDWMGALWRLRQRVDSNATDVVILHSSLAGFLGRLALLGLRRPVAIVYIPHCISFMRRDVGAFKRWVFVALERIACVTPSTYVACSESEQARIRSWLPGVKCWLVENAVHLDPDWRLQKQTASGAKPGRMVISVGQLRAQKNPAMFAKIASAVSRTHPDVKFRWIGDGDLELRQRLGDAGVDVVGWLPKAEVLGELRGASVYVSTSQWEGMPVSLIEAIAAGLPLLVSNCDGNVDVVRHGESGFVFDNVDEAVRYLTLLLDDASISKAFVANAWDGLGARFSFDGYAMKMEALLQAVVARPTSANRSLG